MVGIPGHNLAWTCFTRSLLQLSKCNGFKNKSYYIFHLSSKYKRQQSCINPIFHLSVFASRFALQIISSCCDYNILYFYTLKNFTGSFVWCLLLRCVESPLIELHPLIKLHILNADDRCRIMLEFHSRITFRPFVCQQT